MSDELCWTTATELARKVRDREVTPTEIADVFIERVHQINPKINAIIDFDEEQVRADADVLERQVASGDATGPLHGVPFTIKDLTAVEGRRLTFGMVPMKDEIADHDAVVVQRLRDAGGLFLGKTNTPEAGYYGGTDNHLFGPTHNPWKHGFSAGGSSGGASAAVAAGLGPLAEGSDGAGSVRIPSSLCGVVGLKPSTGRIPQTILAGRYYHWAYHGPITRTVADNALMLDVIAGPDSADPLSLPAAPTSFTDEIAKSIEGLRVAWSPNLGFGDVDPEVVKICEDAVGQLASLGAQITPAEPAWGDPQEAMWKGIWVPGFASEYDLLDWDNLHGQVDEYLIELIKDAEKVTAVDIGRADVFRGGMWDVFSAFMKDYDVLVSPTLCSATFPLDQFAPESLAGTSLQSQLLGWLLTYPYNMMTTPAITVPAGFTSDGRPVGLQIAGGLHADATVLRAAAHLEKVRPWAQTRPPVDE